jgi:hypothetical protein
LPSSVRSIGKVSVNVGTRERENGADDEPRQTAQSEDRIHLPPADGADRQLVGHARPPALEIDTIRVSGLQVRPVGSAEQRHAAVAVECDQPVARFDAAGRRA